MMPRTSADSLLFRSTREKLLLAQCPSLPNEDDHFYELDAESDTWAEQIFSDSIHNSMSQNLQVASIAVLLLLCVILATLLARARHSTQSPATSMYHCGSTNSTAEARALGCEFDILGNSWTPKQCFDNETAAEFREWLEQPERQMGAFPFFHDKEGKVPIMDEKELAETVRSRVYTTQEHHLAHCTFLMRRFFRVGHSEGKLRLNSRYGTLDHTKHCSNEVLSSFRRPDPKHMGGIHAGFHITFERCQ